MKLILRLTFLALFLHIRPVWSENDTECTDLIREKLCRQRTVKGSLCVNQWERCPEDYCYSETEARCNNGICIEYDRFCDGNQYDCSTNEDEGSSFCNVTTKEKIDLCAAGKGRNCSDGKTCVPVWSRCPDDPCAETYTMCPENKKCLNNLKLCDGVRDCPGGLDELTEICKNIQRNTENFFQKHKMIVLASGIPLLVILAVLSYLCGGRLCDLPTHKYGPNPEYSKFICEPFDVFPIAPPEHRIRVIPPTRYRGSLLDQILFAEQQAERGQDVRRMSSTMVVADDIKRMVNTPSRPELSRPQLSRPEISQPNLTPEMAATPAQPPPVHAKGKRRKSSVGGKRKSIHVEGGKKKKGRKSIMVPNTEDHPSQHESQV